MSAKCSKIDNSMAKNNYFCHLFYKYQAICVCVCVCVCAYTQKKKKKKSYQAGNNVLCSLIPIYTLHKHVVYRLAV